ncbi:MAG: SRPBCC family protein [Acidiferrobacterales bacterium]
MIRDENRGRRATVLLLVLVGVSHSMALEIDDVRITRQGRAYTAQLTFDVTASIDQVASVLTDYEHPNRLTPDVTKREVVGRQSGITRVRTEIHSCVVLFCKDLTLTQDVTIVAGTIQADIVPEESDFRSGYVLWLITSNDSGGSHIQYESVIEPDFFIPPVIGRFFIRKRLRQQIFATAENLEREAAREPTPLANQD